jgi:hypothetical protein
LPIYRFGIDMDAVPEGDRFDQAHTDFRTDVQQRHSQLALHDSNSNDLKLARTRADEMVNISGAEVRVYTRTENGDYDRVWDADPDPTYWNCVLMKAFFKPQPLEIELKKWGAESANKTEVVFSHRQVFEQFGERMLRTGDIVVLPYNSATQATAPKTYRITNATPSGNFRYNWLYLTCFVEVLTGDITVRPPDENPMMTDVPPALEGGYRESA